MQTELCESIAKAIISREIDRTVPWAISNASYKREKRNDGVNEIVKMPNRGHALTIGGGWREVADTALRFVQRFVKRQPSRRRTACRPAVT